LPKLSPQISELLKFNKSFVAKRSDKRQQSLYKPYLNERDKMGRLIGCETSNGKELKLSPRQMLPSVFQFNTKWAVKQAVKSTVKGDYESREVAYSADINYVFDEVEEAPAQTCMDFSKFKIRDESNADKSTNINSGSNIANTSNMSFSNSRLETNACMMVSPASCTNRSEILGGFRHFKVNDPK